MECKLCGRERPANAGNFPKIRGRGNRIPVCRNCTSEISEIDVAFVENIAKLVAKEALEDWTPQKRIGE